MLAAKKHAPIAVVAATLAAGFFVLASDSFSDLADGLPNEVVIGAAIFWLIAPASMQFWFATRRAGMGFLVWFLSATTLLTGFWTVTGRDAQLWWLSAAQLGSTLLVVVGLVAARQRGRRFASLSLARLSAGLIAVSVAAAWTLLSWSDANTDDDLSKFDVLLLFAVAACAPFACFGVSRAIVRRFGGWAVTVVGVPLAFGISATFSVWAHRERDVSWALVGLGRDGRTLQIREVADVWCPAGAEARVLERTSLQLRLRVTNRPSRRSCDLRRADQELTVTLEKPFDGEAIVGGRVMRFRLRVEARRVLMPRVIGLRVADARIALGRGSTRLGVVSVAPRGAGGAGGGAVTAQEPAAGAPIGPRDVDDWDGWNRTPIVLTTD